MAAVLPSRLVQAGDLSWRYGRILIGSAVGPARLWSSLNHDRVGRWEVNGEHSGMIAVQEGGSTRAS
jgi:hypothetical protein